MSGLAFDIRLHGEPVFFVNQVDDQFLQGDMDFESRAEPSGGVSLRFQFIPLLSSFAISIAVGPVLVREGDC